MKIKYYNELDGIRGIAALMVMFFHFFQVQLPPSTITSLIIKLSIFGQTGVTLFFVLSGFLITRILLSTKTDKNYYSTFYIRRSLRIFPLYYFFLLIYYYFIPLIRSADTVPFNLQIYHWFYLQNFAVTFKWPHEGPIHFWSLAVEEHFYLFWPVLVYVLNINNLLRCSVILCIIALLCRYILLTNGYDVFYFTFTNIDSLAIGTILGIIEFKGQLLKYKLHFKIGLIMSSISIIIIWVLFGGSRNIIIQLIKPTVLNLTYFSLLGVILTSSRNIITGLLSSKVFRYFGTISYGLYVYHPLCFAYILYAMREQTVFISFLTCFFVAILTSTLSYYIFERRFIDLKKRFTSKP